MAQAVEVIDMNVETAMLLKVVKSAVSSNGIVHVGLAAAQDSLVPDVYRIPIFRNSLKCDSALKLASLARAAYDKVLSNDPTAIGPAVCAFSSYMFGLVTVIGRVPDGELFTAQTASSTRFDAEIKYYDEAPAYKANIEECILPAEHDKLIQPVMSLIFAGKLTWLTTGHHLGTLTTNDERIGYYGKVVAQLGMTHPQLAIDWNNESSRTKAYSTIHPVSSLAVVKILMEGQAGAGDLRQFTQVPRLQGLSFTPVGTAQDAFIRSRFIQAGYAAVGDLIAGIMTLKSSRIAPAAPGIGMAVDLARIHTEVRAHPLKYGIAANYLTDNAEGTVDRFNKEDFEELTASLSAYLAIARSKSTLLRSALFSRDYENMPGYSEFWAGLCRAYKKKVTAPGGINDVLLEELQVTTAGGIIPRANPEFVAAMQTIGVTIDAESWNANVETITQVVGRRRAQLNQQEADANDNDDDEGERRQQGGADQVQAPPQAPAQPQAPAPQAIRPQDLAMGMLNLFGRMNQ